MDTMYLELNPLQKINWKEGGYRNTIPEKTNLINIKTNDILVIERHQWSKVLDTVVTELKSYIEACVENGDFETVFNTKLNDILEYTGIYPNVSFSRTLFKDTSFIKSSLYKTNKNHKLELYNDPTGTQNNCICAVFIDEIIWVMKALIDTINEITGIQFCIEIEYANKKQRIDTLEEGNPRLELAQLANQMSEIVQQLTDIISKTLSVMNKL